jgi:hypothetical protein
VNGSGSRTPEVRDHGVRALDPMAPGLVARLEDDGGVEPLAHVRPVAALDRRAQDWS